MVISRLLGVLPPLGVTESQVNPGGLVAAALEKGRLTAEFVLVSETLCCTGVAPANTVTLIEDWLTLISGVVLTSRVTGTTSGAAVEPGTLMVSDPLQTWDVVRPVVTTETTT